MSKFAIIFSSILIAVSASFAFDWPQRIGSLNDVSRRFATPRGNSFSTGIEFSQNGDVFASDQSDALILLSVSNSLDEFDSPLGNAVVAMDDDGIMTVFANLDEVFVNNETHALSAGMPVGSSGGSAWQGADAGCIFQFLDAETSSAIDPVTILPSVDSGKNAAPSFSLRAVSTDGKEFSLSKSQSLPSGKYSIYCQMTHGFFVQKTNLSLNGVSVESIDFSRLLLADLQLCVAGQSPYNYATSFRDDDVFLGRLQISRGHSQVSAEVVDFNGHSLSATCNIDAY